MGNKPTTLDDLRTKMTREFVPANEIAEARIHLIEMKREKFSKLQDFISKFKDLIMLFGTPTSGAYIYFFNSMLRAMKGKFTEKIPTSQPIDRFGNPNIQAVFDYVRTLELSMKMSGEMQKSSQRSQRHGGKRENTSKARTNTTYSNIYNATEKKEKDPHPLSWGLLRRVKDVSTAVMANAAYAARSLSATLIILVERRFRDAKRKERQKN